MWRPWILSQIRLYHLGDEAAVYIYDQNGDNRLDVADYILFYGRPVDSRYAKYTARQCLLADA